MLFRSMGYSLIVVDAQRRKLWNGYLSYNHSKFAAYWGFREHWVKHSVKDVIVGLHRAIGMLEYEEIKPALKTDCWEATKETFMFLLMDILEKLCDLPDNAMCLDGDAESDDDAEEDAENNNTENNDAEEKTAKPVVYFRSTLGSTTLRSAGDAAGLCARLLAAGCDKKSDDVQKLKALILAWDEITFS